MKKILLFAFFFVAFYWIAKAQENKEVYASLQSIDSLAFTEENYSVADPFAYEKLLNNPNYEPLTIKRLRAIATLKFGGLAWQRNIIAGNVLEIAFAEWSGMNRNGTNYDNEIREASVRPDFVATTAKIYADENLPYIFPNGAWFEVKATENDLELNSFRKQLYAELDALSKETSLMGFSGRALKALSYTLILPFGTEISEEIFQTAYAKYGINVYVSYAFLNMRTQKVLFSSRIRKNGDSWVYVNDNFPYKTLEGIPFDWEKAIPEKWK
jgi:hypothetical protein